MKHLWGFTKLLTIIAITTISFQVQSETIILSDFDDTILESRKSKGGSFKTNVILYRINTRGNVMQKDLREAPETIEVSSTDYYSKLEKNLAHGEAEPGPISLKVTLEDGREIRPGIYTTNPHHSYKYFHESQDGQNYLLKDFKLAEKNDPTESWKGPFWNRMVDALSSEDTAKNFGLVTSRGHSTQEWEEFFKYLKRQKYIEHLPNFKLVFSLARPEFEQFNPNNNEAEQKANVVEYVLSKLKHLQPNPTPVLDPDGKTHVESHYVVFAENKQSILERVYDVFRRFAQGKSLKVKFGLFNSGLDSEIKKSRKAQFSIIQNSGTTRPAKYQERRFIRKLSCNNIFQGVAL